MICEVKGRTEISTAKLELMASLTITATFLLEQILIQSFSYF